MGIKCRRPLLSICGDVSRIVIAMGKCRSCSPGAVSLRIEQALCGKMVESCKDVDVVVGQVCGEPVTVPCTRRVLEQVPSQGVTYPLHEINAKGEAVFIIDSKFSAMGFGRYTGTVSFGDCGSTCIDIDYTCGATQISRVSAHTMEGC